ncbi:unnamed protein product [Urochloa decumbens]|uniref:F-box domain-containing protein n=1 Tax=Urochloa decumbens TaxID=240449 RepID=A0ABC9E4H9_9POAL
MAAAATTADPFSDVPDDLLVHIISFLPVRDAARTAVLARRWRPLWLLTGSINLDSASYRKQTRTYSYYNNTDDEIDGGRLFADAADALAAIATTSRPKRPVRRMSLFMEAYSDQACGAALGFGSGGRYSNHDNNYSRLQYLLVEPSLRELEEVRVGFRLTKDDHLRYILKLVLRPEFLPSAQSLRVLDLAFTRLELPTAAGGGVSFPRLASVRLVKCSILISQLEALTRAAPALAALHIESPDGGYGIHDTDRLLLHCPNLVALTMADAYLGSVIDLYAPRLRSFSYSGGLRSTKALKLRLLHVKHLLVDEGALDEPLPVLYRLERLELEAPQDPDRRKDSAAAMATLLRQCPVICHCQLQFEETYSWRRKGANVRSKFDASVELFNKRESKEINALMLEDDGEDSSCVPDLPGLTGCWFSCLQSHLKYVKLQFELTRLNCFEVCLAKFFAENCKVLEALQIEDGDQHFLSHINRKVERWRLNALN